MMGLWREQIRKSLVVSVCRIPTFRVMSMVVKWTHPVPRGHPSSTATAKGELHGIISHRWASSSSIKFPAAPESIKAFVVKLFVANFIVIGISMHDVHWLGKKEVLTLWADCCDGRVRQLTLRWPAWPQYRQRCSLIQRSCSSIEFLHWFRIIWGDASLMQRCKVSVGLSRANKIVNTDR